MARDGGDMMRKWKEPFASELNIAHLAFFISILGLALHKNIAIVR
jgi:hypothetical protein